MNNPDGDSFLFDADDVVGIAHEEGYQESSMTTLMEYLEGIEVDGEMTLAELCTTLGWGIPEVYIPLLFLALDGRSSGRGVLWGYLRADFWWRLRRLCRRRLRNNVRIRNLFYHLFIFTILLFLPILLFSHKANVFHTWSL